MSRKAFIFWFVLIPDIVLLYASLVLAVAIRYGSAPDGVTWATHVRAFSLLYPFWLLVLFIYNVFDISSFRRYFIVFYKVVVAMAVNLLAAVTYFYFQPSLILTPRRFLLIHVGITAVLLIGWHLVIKYILKNRLSEKLYVFSLTNELDELEREIRRHDYMGYTVLGHITEDTLPSVIFDKNSSIILPDALHARPEVLARLYELRKVGMVFYNHKAFYESLLRRIYLSRVNQMWFLENVNYKEKRLYTLVKRLVDISLSLVGLLVTAITFPLLAILIKLTSPGPVFFVQQRTGQGGQAFTVYKYRTMKADNPANTWTSVRDPRVTTFGRFLRMSRIDEWPQFIHVFIGTMSLVGPRPEQPHIVEALRRDIPFYDERHMVKPGITGWAQINDTYAATIEETKFKLQYDLYYIKHRSFLFDLEILLKTMYYALSWKGR